MITIICFLVGVVGAYLWGYGNAYAKGLKDGRRIADKCWLRVVDPFTGQVWWL